MKFASLPPETRGTIFLCAGAMCISFSPLFVKFVEAGPLTAAFYRMFWGGLVLTALAVIKGQRITPYRALLPAMFLGALFFSGDLACWHISILYLGPGLATILSNFQVFFLAIIGALFLKEHLSPRLKIAIPLAIAGLLLVLEMDPRKLPPNISYGIVVGIASGALYSGYLLCLRHSQLKAERLPALANMGVISLFTAVILVGMSLAAGESLIITDTRSNLLLLLYGAGCQGLGWYLISSGLPLVPASRAGLLILIQPALSFVWDIVLLGRPTGSIGYFGAMLALAAICLGSLNKKANT